jgi:transcriptional regulator of acetoin/glycerol metabolism
MTFAEAMTACAGEYLRDCLERSNGNVKAAAHVAGMDRSSFYRLCQRCGIPTQLGKRPKTPFTAWVQNRSA